MTAPTEQEIREALTKHRAWVTFSDAFTELGGALDALYDESDFRPSEVEALNSAGYDVVEPIERRVRAEVMDALVRGAIRFGAEYPDAQRAEKAVPA